MSPATKSYRLSTIWTALYGFYVLMFFGGLGLAIYLIIICNDLVMRLWLGFCLAITYWLCTCSTAKNFGWRVCVSDLGLEVSTITGNRKIHWNRIQRIANAAMDGLKVYVVETSDKCIIIPALMDKESELFQIIKNHLASDAIPATSFNYVDPVIAMCKAVLHAIIAFTFMMVGILYVLLMPTKELGLTIIATILSLIAIYILALYDRAAKTVNVTSTGLTIVTWFGLTHQIDYDQIKSLYSISIPLPMGLLINSQRGWFFLDNELKGLDELKDLIQSQITIDRETMVLKSDRANVPLLGAEPEDNKLVDRIKKSPSDEDA